MVSKKKDVSIEVPSVKIEAQTSDVGPQSRHRKPNRANFEIEEKSGKDWSENLGRFVSYYRRVDRTNDMYYEKIVDDETGQVLRECEEPLSLHTGRGTAKGPKK